MESILAEQEIPDSISDEKALKRSVEKNKELVKEAEKKIDTQECVGCGKCAELCPMKNLSVKHNLAKAQDRCTMCYRCINICPKQAITLLGKKVVEQGTTVL